MKNPVIGYVFDARGPMAGISVKGTKFSKIDPK
jgi:hypothetical protein